METSERQAGQAKGMLAIYSGVTGGNGGAGGSSVTNKRLLMNFSIAHQFITIQKSLETAGQSEGVGNIFLGLAVGIGVLLLGALLFSRLKRGRHGRRQRR